MLPSVSASNPVRVSLPVSVASEIGSLKKAVAGVLDQLGCPACCSGFDLFIELQREIAFTRELRADPDVFLPAKRSLPMDPVPARRAALNPEFGSSLDNVFSAIDKIAELSGHTACATGCDMLFQIERQFVINPALEIRELSASFG